MSVYVYSLPPITRDKGFSELTVLFFFLAYVSLCYRHVIYKNCPDGGGSSLGAQKPRSW